ncbi:MAG: hypothetical protein AAB581_02470 [Patescibacteria group bacterium]
MAEALQVFMGNTAEKVCGDVVELFFADPNLEQKGAITEEAFIRALRELINEGKIFGFMKDDLSGQDFIIITLRRSLVPFEAKTSYFGKFLHEIIHENPVCVVCHQILRPTERQMRRLVSKAKTVVTDLLILEGELAA